MRRAPLHSSATPFPLALAVVLAGACGHDAPDARDARNQSTSGAPSRADAASFEASGRSDAGPPPVRPLSSNTVVVEAEEMRVRVAEGDRPGFRARPFGTNYYAATLADSFLSRKAYLGAPEQCAPSSASIEVSVPSTGRYLALVRYEATPRFATEFRLTVEQNGASKLDRLYGARMNTKIWPFRQGLAAEVVPPWGSSDSIVWEGHDAVVELEEGVARLTLTAGPQPTPAARRNVDVVLLTSDLEDVTRRIEKEGYLPLDGLLTQTGDVLLDVTNRGASPLILTVPPGIEHSPYWVHLRDWKPKKLVVAPGASSGWTQVGDLLDALNDGDWKLTAANEGGKGTPLYDLDVGVPGAPGKVERIGHFTDRAGPTTLAYAADTRASRTISLADDALYSLTARLRAQKVRGVPPARTPIFGMTFGSSPDDPRYRAASAEFVRLMGAPQLAQSTSTHGVGLIDLRHVPTDKLEAECAKLRADGRADAIRVVSLGDEISLALPKADDHAAFRAWLRTKVDPSHLDPAIGPRFDALTYSPDAQSRRSHPGLHYWSKVYGYRFGIQALKTRTDILRKCLPAAAIGANFSPHIAPMYLGSTHQFVSLFREGGLTMPWGEDYVWQVPVVSPQVTGLMVDTFRAALRGRYDRRLLMYVMPHMPGNTPRAWRRQLYSDVAHGANLFSLFELRPVQASYTENHVDAPEMYEAIREALHELGTFDDLVQDGLVQAGSAALFRSEAADVWEDLRTPFDAHLRALYVALRQDQVPLDVVVEGDALGSYQALYLTDAHVSVAASRAIAKWVEGGGQLVAMAGAGMYDELDRPNRVLRQLLGVSETSLEIDAEPIRHEKQDLPFARVMDTVHLQGGGTLPVLSARSRFSVSGASVVARFDDGAAAATTRAVGRGTARYLGFLPGFAVFRPAIPMRPMDRVSDDDAMCHLMPTGFDATAAATLRVGGLRRSVVASSPSVEASLLTSPRGLLVPLVNWSSVPARGLRVTIAGVRCASCTDGRFTDVTRASGKPVRAQATPDGMVLDLDLDIADALIFVGAPGNNATAGAPANLHQTAPAGAPDPAHKVPK